MGGSNTANQPGVYGTRGTPAAGNIPGGRYGSVTWTDASGHLWLFGGNSYGPGSIGNVDFNDLWEFDSVTSEWTWISGSDQVGQPGVYGTLGTPAATNAPGSRESAVSWTDSSGNLWLFGGEGVDSLGENGSLNDLWKFDPSTSEWTWMGGSSTVGASGGQAGVYGTMGTPAAQNLPGGRFGAVGWKDGSGNFWLMGGQGFDSADASGYLNDLWEFDPSTLQWAWMSGNSTLGKDEEGFPGVYGTPGTPAAANSPGSREYAMSWTDASGNFWLFGGEGFDGSVTTIGSITTSNFGYLNDLWEFNTATAEWTWMGGNSTVPESSGLPGEYGSLGILSTSNITGGRSSGMVWTDNHGSLWLFGGYGVNASGAIGYLNDLWVFVPATSEWGWMNGSSSTLGAAGVYGTLKTPADGNTPGGREAGMNWTDSQGNLWLFGGAFEEGISTYLLNDLWEYVPASTMTSSTVTLSPASLNFGSQAESITSSAQTVKLTNAGTPNLTITSITASGAFAETNTCGSSVAPGGSCTISVTFTPASTGFFAGALTVTDSAVGSTQTLALSGTGVVGIPAATVSPTSLSFGSQAVGTTSPVQTVTLTDSGTATLTIVEITVTAPYAQTNNCGTSVAPGANCTISITFNPPGPVNYPGDLIVTDLAADDEQTVTLSGAGAASGPNAAATPTFSPAGGSYTSAQMVTVSDSTSGATIYYTTNGATPTTSSTIYAGPITVGSTETIKAIATASGYSTSAVASASYTINLPVVSIFVSPSSGLVYDQTATVTTTTNQTVLLGEWWITEDGLNCSQFGIVCGAHPNISGGGFVTTTSPLGAGTHTFYAYYSATPPPNNTLPSTGIPEVVLVVAQATPAITWATPAPITQGTPLSSTQLDATASVPGTFAYNPPSGTVPKAGQQTLSVTFTPTDTTDYTSATASVILTVNPAVPVVTLSPASLSFSALDTGSTSAAQTVMLTNSGAAVLNLTSIAASGDFAETNTCGSSVAAGASCTISVTFTPTAGGARTGTLTITDNASGSPQTVALTGTGSTVTETPSSNSLTISSAGGTATDTIQLSAVGDFSGMVSLTCTVTYTGTGTATDAPTCTLSPTQAQVSSASSASTTLNVSTTASGSADLKNPFLPVGGATLAAMLIFIGVPRRKWRSLSLMAVLGIAIAGVCMGCGGRSPGGGGTSSNPGTTTGSYNVTVTATSGSTSTSLTIPLSLQ